MLFMRKHKRCRKEKERSTNQNLHKLVNQTKKYFAFNYITVNRIGTTQVSWWTHLLFMRKHCKIEKKNQLIGVFIKLGLKQIYIKLYKRYRSTGVLLNLNRWSWLMAPKAVSDAITRFTTTKGINVGLNHRFFLERHTTFNTEPLSLKNHLFLKFKSFIYHDQLPMRY